MPRQPRIQYQDALYHIFSRGNFDQDLFLNESDFELFIGLLSVTQRRHNFRVFSYCLMTNHYHLLLGTPDGNLAQGMQHLNGVYATAFNTRNDHYGHVMQGRYNYRLIEHEAYFCQVARYIVLNPVHAGLVQQPAEWRFSSFRATVGSKETPRFLDKAGLLSFFGDAPRGKPDSFLEFTGHPSAADLEFDEDLVLLRPTLKKIFASHEKDYAVAEAVTKWMYTLREVGEYLGVSRTTIWKIIKEVDKRV